ncbi:MAG TPA: adenosine deaminase [Gemmatimonadaceae bacterium]
MPAVTRELLRALPKAELHCHLDGSLRPHTLIELGREYGIAMPAWHPDALADFMMVRDARHLEDYLQRFAITLSVLQHADALERVSYELVEDAAREGVRYIEIRYAPVLNLRHGLSLGEAVEAPLRGIERAQRDFGTLARVIICGLRHLSPEISFELAELAAAYRGRGVVGFDLAGAELGHPARAHAAAFDFARRHDLALTVHAGEGAGADSVREAVFDCYAERIGHATHLVDDEMLSEYVNDHRIALEICLTSNVQTHAVASYEEHPLRAYHDRGMNVVLNTDNRLMSGTTLTDEYLLAARHLDFTFEELAEIALNSFASAFLPWPERHALMEAARGEIERLRDCP